MWWSSAENSLPSKYPSVCFCMQKYSFDILCPLKKFIKWFRIGRYLTGNILMVWLLFSTELPIEFVVYPWICESEVMFQWGQCHSAEWSLGGMFVKRKSFFRFCFFWNIWLGLIAHSGYRGIFVSILTIPMLGIGTSLWFFFFESCANNRGNFENVRSIEVKIQFHIRDLFFYGISSQLRFFKLLIIQN